MDEQVMTFGQEHDVSDAKLVSVIAAEWSYENSTIDPPIPMTTWVLVNMDGSIYVNWELAERFKNQPLVLGRPGEVNQTIMARLLFAARGRFPEVSEARSLEIAREAAQAVNSTMRLDVGNATQEEKPIGFV